MIPSLPLELYRIFRVKGLLHDVPAMEAMRSCMNELEIQKKTVHGSLLLPCTVSKDNTGSNVSFINKSHSEHIMESSFSGELKVIEVKYH